MPVYRIELTLKGSLGTDLLSGTVWGHLAWALRYLEGEAALMDWLQDQVSRPWLLSSRMPVGMLPRPILKPVLRKTVRPSLKEMELEKRAKGLAYIPETVFQLLRNEMSDEALSDVLKRGMGKWRIKESLPRKGINSHNTIDRLSGTTPDVGGLFFEAVFYPGEDTKLQIFLHTPDPCLDRIEALFAFVGENGFGSNSSTGNGNFTCEVKEESTLFSAKGNRAMSLSHGVITESMKDARYKQHVHFGKLGGDYAKGSYSPFKYPILMARPGATFQPEGNGPFGKLLDAVHHDPELKKIRHHAFHLPLYYTEVQS
ncbi:MAG TPA: hypothetical protein PLM79_01015 [Syntrophobacteraceae bacterium]|nr:hypothetical protein [Syntrophobacteraceae bacterium]